MQCQSLWIKASAKCINVNVNEHLWLAIAFISSTASCVIGYNAQSCKNTYGSANADLNLAADDMTCPITFNGHGAIAGNIILAQGVSYHSYSDETDPIEFGLETWGDSWWSADI